MTTRAYVRISTEDQSSASQLEQITTWLAARGLDIERTYVDQSPGTTPWNLRLIKRACDDAAPGDLIIASELSRIARSTLGVLRFLEYATERGVMVATTKQGHLVDDTITTKILVVVLALCAEIERDLLKTRTKSGMDAARARGKHVGRPHGSTRESKIHRHKIEIARLIAAQIPMRAIARLLQCSASTLYEYLRAQNMTPSQARPGLLQNLRHQPPSTAPLPAPEIPELWPPAELPTFPPSRTASQGDVPTPLAHSNPN